MGFSIGVLTMHEEHIDFLEQILQECIQLHKSEPKKSPQPIPKIRRSITSKSLFEY